LQRQTRKAWGQRRADAVISAAEATLALWGPSGLDDEALAADIAARASLALALSRQIAGIDERIFDLYCDADPDQLLLSVPGVGKILAGQIRGRLGDPHRFTSLAAARAFSGLIPRQNSSGLTDTAGGPTKQGDACLREALFLAADHARKTDPTLAARYQIPPEIRAARRAVSNARSRQRGWDERTSKESLSAPRCRPSHRPA
jgi:transposase